MMFSIFPAELLWEWGEYRVIWAAEEEPEAISEWRSGICRRKGWVCPPMWQNCSSLPGNSKWRTKVCATSNRISEESHSRAAKRASVPAWWAAWNEVGFNFLFTEVCRKEEMGRLWRFSTKQTFQASWFLVLPQKKRLGTSYLLLRDNVIQKKRGQKKILEQEHVYCVRAEPQLGQRVSLTLYSELF